MVRARPVPAAAALLLCVVAAALLAPRLSDRDLTGEDIFHVWRDSRRIAEGHDPYARILGGDMRVNQKYATYLPGFYLVVAAATSVAGTLEFDEWLAAWRPIAL